MSIKEAPAPAKTAAILVIAALAVLVFLHKGFAGIDVQLG